MKIGFKRLSEDAVIPTRATEGSVAVDLYSTYEGIVKAKSALNIRIDIAWNAPNNVYATIEGRSGLASRNGIDILGGVIDGDYRGAWSVLLFNTSNQDMTFKKGDRIAQAIIQRKLDYDIVEVNDLSETERSDKGFGSTGL